jgi:hypothetical protein
MSHATHLIHPDNSPERAFVEERLHGIATLVRELEKAARSGSTGDAPSRRIVSANPRIERRLSIAGAALSLAGSR